jgi:hypothetical protein
MSANTDIPQGHMENKIFRTKIGKYTAHNTADTKWYEKFLDE